MTISEEEFAVWRADPVTQHVIEILGAMADAQKEAWLIASWDGSNCDPVLLTELKTRADAYGVFAGGSYEDWFGEAE